jgi:hypothetical protein
MERKPIMPLETLKKTHGGARPGAGMPKGHKTAKTIEKEAAREILRDLVKANLQPMVEAQVANAKGIKYLVVRNAKTGKFLRVTEAMAKLKIGKEGDEEIIEVWEKDPSVHAFQDLMDRTLDKPSQPVAVEHSGTIDVVGRLAEARKRLNSSRSDK